MREDIAAESYNYIKYKAVLKNVTMKCSSISVRQNQENNGAKISSFRVRYLPRSILQQLMQITERTHAAMSQKYSTQPTPSLLTIYRTKGTVLRSVSAFEDVTIDIKFY